jgi:hypothetical protein
MQRTNVCAGSKEQILKGFSNMPEILLLSPELVVAPRHSVHVVEARH